MGTGKAKSEFWDSEETAQRADEEAEVARAARSQNGYGPSVTAKFAGFFTPDRL